MADYDLYPEDTTKVQFGDKPGYLNIWVQEFGKFVTIAEAPETGAEEGETMIIVDDHVFVDGSGFRHLTLYREGATAESASGGDAGFPTGEYMVKGFVVGDKPWLKELVERGLAGKGLIVLVEDPECNNPRKQQLGCKCSPAVLKEHKFGSGGLLTGGKKGYELTFAAPCPLMDYEGAVAVLGADPFDAPVLDWDSPELSWTATGDNAFVLQYATENTFIAPVTIEVSGANTYDFAAILATLGTGNYYARVRNKHAATTWSNIETIANVAEEFDVPVINLDTVTIDWPDTGDTHYVVQLGASGFSTIHHEQTITDNIFDWGPILGMAAPATYYMRVRNLHEDDTWSNVVNVVVS